MDERKPFVVACVPAFNEKGGIAGVVAQARKYVGRGVVCGDGSRDLTGAMAEGLGAVVRHERIRGYGASLRSLFRESLGLGADYVVTLDSDGQHDPAEIPGLVERLRAGDVDVVVGSRSLEHQHLDHEDGVDVGYASMGALVVEEALEYGAEPFPVYEGFGFCEAVA